MSEALDGKTDTTNFGQVSPSSYVGFSQYPDHCAQYQSTIGFSFHILLVGESGIGKTTLVNSLFKLSNEVTATHPHPAVSQRTYTLFEGQTTLKLTISETVGYGLHASDDSHSWPTVCSFLDEHHCSRLDAELGRPHASPGDSQVHCCLYFLPPYTRKGLRAFDATAMSHISSRVNLVPVIAKSDSLTRAEAQSLKGVIRETIKSNKIQIYSFLNILDSSHSDLNAFVPFAVVGSTTEVGVGNRRAVGRKYPWGVIQVENFVHCDFARLREGVIRTNMFELIESTDEIYERFRRGKLDEYGCEKGRPVSIDEIYKRKKEDMSRYFQFRESVLRNSLMKKIKVKEKELRSLDKEMEDKSREMELAHSGESALLDEKFAELNEEIRSFNEMRDLFTMRASSLPRPKRK